MNRLHSYVTTVLIIMSWLTVGIGIYGLTRFVTAVSDSSDSTVKPGSEFIFFAGMGIMIATGVAWALLQGAAIALDYLADIRDSQTVYTHEVEERELLGSSR